MLQHWTMSSPSHVNSALRRQLSVTMMIVMILGAIPHRVLPSSPPFVKDLPRHQKLILGNVNRWVNMSATGIKIMWQMWQVWKTLSQNMLCVICNILVRFWRWLVSSQVRRSYDKQRQGGFQQTWESWWLGSCCQIIKTKLGQSEAPIIVIWPIRGQEEAP